VGQKREAEASHALHTPHSTPLLPRPHTYTHTGGVINKVGADHVGILTLGAVNAAVGADRVRVGFAPPAPRGTAAAAAAAAAKDAAWVHETDPAHTLAVGTPVLYECVRVRADGGGFATLVGSFEPEHTGVEGKVPPPPARWRPTVRHAAVQAATEEATALPDGGGGGGAAKKRRAAGDKAPTAAAAAPRVKGGGVKKKKKKAKAKDATGGG